jgi:alkylation response protein AidB-like acyl-CoA dehydrogenase
MDLILNPDEQIFRNEIVHFVDRAFPVSIRERPSAADEQRWHEAVANEGWTAAEWPVDFGGPGWTAMEIYLWYSVTLRANCPPADYCGLHVVGPLLQQFGDPGNYWHLDNISNHTVTWGNAVFLDGSSSLQHTSEGERHLLQGQTPCISTSRGIDWVLLLVETGDAYSLFLADLNLEGVHLLPVEATSNVFRLVLNQVYLPASCLLGEMGKGLEYLVFLMTGFESVSLVVHLQVAIANLKKAVVRRGLGNELRARLAELEIEVTALETTSLRSHLSLKSDKTPIVAIRGHSLASKISDSFRDALGYYALPDEQAIPGSNEPVLSESGIELYYRQTDPLPGCPPGFRQDLVAKTILGL